MSRHCSVYKHRTIIWRPAIFIYFPLFNKVEWTATRRLGSIYIGHLIFIANAFAVLICFRLSESRVSCGVVSARFASDCHFLQANVYSLGCLFYDVLLTSRIGSRRERESIGKYSSSPLLSWHGVNDHYIGSRASRPWADWDLGWI